MHTKLVWLCCFLLMAFTLSGQNNEQLTADDLDVKMLNFKELEPLLNTQDDVVHVVNFWATWCAPCIKELPYFQEIHDRYKDKVNVLLVSLDFPQKLESQLIPFVLKKNLTPTVVLLNDPHENEWIPKVNGEWTGALPATLIYSKNVRKFYEGSFAREDLLKEVNEFLNL